MVSVQTRGARLQKSLGTLGTNLNYSSREFRKNYLQKKMHSQERHRVELCCASAVFGNTAESAFTEETEGFLTG